MEQQMGDWGRAVSPPVMMVLQIADVSIFHPAGELDPLEGGELMKKIRRFLHRDWSKIVLDLTEVNHIHYRVLGDLLRLATASAVRAGGIKLANLTPYNREILRLAGLERFFETYDSVAEAILSFQSQVARPCELQ